MTGWQRFFLVFALCIVVLVCWPQYDMQGITFMALAFCLWTCVVLLLSILIDLFAIYKVEFLHRLISLIFLLAVIGSLLFYFPLQEKQTPVIRLQKGQWPTTEDIQTGIRRLTFNFDFARRNVHREKNYINQKMDKSDLDKTKKEVKKVVKKSSEILDIVVDPKEEDK